MGEEATNVVKSNNSPPSLSLHSKWLLYQHDKRRRKKMDKASGGK
jgi:hypothetical protein